MRLKREVDHKVLLRELFQMNPRAFQVEYRRIERALKKALAGPVTSPRFGSD